jgi:hypothetical protein
MNMTNEYCDELIASLREYIKKQEAKTTDYPPEGLRPESPGKANSEEQPAERVFNAPSKL